ncbi:MAG: hypothetical protein H6Q20_342 [Bacteroidetes bacterium]|nr:hypothetical protein [Bacteroidota bacterium]
MSNIERPELNDGHTHLNNKITELNIQIGELNDKNAVLNHRNGNLNDETPHPMTKTGKRNIKIAVCKENKQKNN